MAKQTVKTKTSLKRGIEDCRVVDIGMEKYAECLQQGPATCAYALPFGYCFLCGHPRVNEIIENTRNNPELQAR